MTSFGDTQVQGDDEREDSRKLSLQGNKPPAEIDGFTMIRRLGTGAYGTVWLAREDNTGRTVAIKYYPHRRGLDWSLLSREVEKLAELYTSRNIVQLLHVGWNAEPPYYVMEYVENGPLSAMMARGPMSTDDAVRIAKEVCGALIEAHGAGVLHCDLKPDNVLLDAQMQVRLCDFGQSRMSHERSPALGTLYYMAPEQADLEAVADARWDVYAVGALLYHMLTGNPPYRTLELQQELEATTSLDERLKVYRRAIMTSPAPSAHQSVSGVDNRLARVIASCLTVDPSKRLPNAQAILAELETRDRLKARRPLILLGVLAPLLLIAAMVPIFVNALQRNLDEMERRLDYRALESDAVSARAVAGALEAELEGRLTDLQDILTNEQLIGHLGFLDGSPEEQMASVLAAKQSATQKPDEMPGWLRALTSARQRADVRNRDRNHAPDTSWFLQARDGRQIWRHPVAGSIGKNWAYRDYFHGRNREFPENAVPNDIRPIISPHVSLPFPSTVTGQYMVALSVPVRNKSGKVIGVLARTAHLADLRERLADYIRDTKARKLDDDPVVREIALADARSGELLDHPWLTDQPPEVLESVFNELKLSDETLDYVHFAPGTDNEPPSELLLGDYIDPVGQLSAASAKRYDTEWMASMARMNHEITPWVVIVQEKRENMRKPIEDMTQQVLRTACVAVLTSVLLMSIVWIFVGRAITRSEPKHV